jgi:hypothetical protein
MLRTEYMRADRIANWVRDQNLYGRVVGQPDNDAPLG